MGALRLSVIGDPKESVFLENGEMYEGMKSLNAPPEPSEEYKSVVLWTEGSSHTQN